MLRDFEISGILAPLAQRYRVIAVDRPGLWSHPDTCVGRAPRLDPAAEISRLRRENDRLRMERDI
jgi:pimeloyl-ACP methyl ester carboxylesterase